MNANQANRARIAERARTVHIPGRPSVDPLARTASVEGVGSVRNRRSPRLTATQRDSTGRYSDWNRSPFEPFGGWR